MSDIYFGIGTPQANPTVDLEFQQFFRGPERAVIARLISPAETPAERLTDYIEQLPRALASFDTMPLSAFGFACTGSAYLVGREQELAYAEQASTQFDVPIVTATQAIHRELILRGVRSIAMLAPYPAQLCDAAVAYWAQLGFEFTNVARIDIGDDTRAIYEITDDEVTAALDGFDSGAADVVFLSGTGMPTINALLHTELPMLSSNLCLAAELLRYRGFWPQHRAADIKLLCGDT